MTIFLRRAFLIFLAFGGVSAWAQSVGAGETALKMRPGETLRTPSGEVVQCLSRMCKVEFVYVGKIFRVTLPDGKSFGEFKERSEALSVAKTLVDSKTCDALDLKLE